MHHTKRPVLIVPRGAEAPGDGPVILAYDGSEPARRGIVAAAGLIPGREAISTMVWTSYETVTAMGDIGMPAAVAVAGAQRIDEELAVKALHTAEEGAAVAREAGMSASAEAVREHGNTSGTLIDSAAKHAAAAIVIGSHGRSAMGAAVLGSVAMGLVHTLPGPAAGGARPLRTRPTRRRHRGAGARRSGRAARCPHGLRSRVPCGSR